MSITLQHKVIELANTKGEEAQISDINNLKILVNGYDNDLYVIPRKEGETPLIKEAGLDGNILEGFSIFEKFIVNDGTLTHEKVFVTFWDEETAQELLVKEMRNPSLLATKIFNHTLEDEEAEKIINNLTQLAIENEKGETKEEQKKEEPEVVQVEVPKEEVAPIVEEVSASTEVSVDKKAEEPKAEEKKEEPKAEEVPVAEQTDKQLEETEIPELVIAQYKDYTDTLFSKGFEEFKYKNYRFLTNFFNVKEDDIYKKLENHTSYCVLLTPSGVAIMQKLVYFEPIKKSDTVIKYRFLIDKKDPESRKYLYFDTANKSVAIKKPKKAELKADEKKEEKVAEAKA